MALQPLIADENSQDPPAPCVVPLLIHIDNHYADAAAPGPNTRPQELLVPLLSLASSRNGRDQNARIAAMLAFSKRISPDREVVEQGEDGKVGRADRIAILYPRAHPGTEPPLGWVMSKVSRIDLVKQLHNGEVTAELAKAQRWFSPGALNCIPLRR
jgi:hypothetical protein